MAKRSQRRPVRSERDQLGCMWGLISMFDFRHARSTQKLLADRRRWSKRTIVAGNPRNKLDKSTYSNENCQGSLDCEDKRAALDACKPSVKKLIEEEMFSEQDLKQEINNDEIELKQSDSEHEGLRKKNHRKTNKTRKKTCDNIHVIGASENLGSKCHHNSEQQSTNSLDLDNMMKEFCRQIHQKSMSCVQHDLPGELHLQSNQKNCDFKEKLSEVIKFLISQKLANGKHLTEDGEIHTSKDFMEALQILGSDEELFLKLLQDPDSLLSKDIQDLQNARIEKEKNPKSVAGSNLSEQQLGGVAQSDVPASRKQRNFFRRRVKSQERNPLDENSTSQASNRIVILKPGPKGLLNPETENSLGSSPEAHHIARNKGQSERVGSHFFFTEIKRKLKHAMGKEQNRIPTDGISKRVPYERQNSGDKDRGIKENIGRNSPTIEHFFIERIARPSNGVKKGDKTGKLKDLEIGMEHDSSDYPKQRVSNVYIEAKKHLSEMLSNGDEDVEFSSKQVPRSLGRILSFSEYNSPVGSPGKNWEHSFVTAKMRFSTSEDFEKVNENKQENHLSHLGQTTQNSETQPCISDDKTDNRLQARNSVSTNLAECNDNESDEICSTRVGMSSEGNVEIVEATEIIVQEESNAMDTFPEPGNVEIVEATEIIVQEESNAVDTFPERGSSSITRDDQNDNTLEVCYEKSDSECLKQDSSEEIQPPSPTLASLSNSSIKKVEYLESATDITERPSPVSVLEPLFTEDDISPASTRSHSVEIRMQPLQIQFEEHESSDADQGGHMKNCMDDKELILENVKAVLKLSDFTWDELYMKSLSSDQLLEPSLIDDVEFFPNQLCPIQKLLFDCINEVLMEFCGHQFGCSPWVSFVKPKVWPVPKMENITNEVQEGVYWHLLPLPLPHTLDQIIRKDMTKAGTWMDYRFDTDCIGLEMGEAILDELMEETIASCVYASRESEYSLLSSELKEDESSINL